MRATFRDIGGSSIDGARSDVTEMISSAAVKQPQDIIATGILVIIIPFGILFHLFYVIPEWYPVLGEAWVIQALFIGFFTFNLYTNWIMMMRIGPSGKSLLPTVVKPGYKYCHSCCLNTPPRAYHCPVCEVCVLRRDHHCSFGAVCVGHFNQRYFVAAALNLLCLSFQLSSFAWSLVEVKLGGIAIEKIWFLVLPHLATFAGFISIYQFLHIIILAMTALVFLFSFYLVSAQAFVLWRGQTRYEYLLEVHAYQLGLFENIRQSLGSRWFLTPFSAFIPSPLPSNGLTFMTREMHSAHTKEL